MTKRYLYQHNWVEIQEFYSNGNTIEATQCKFGFGWKMRKKAINANLLEMRSQTDAQILAKSRLSKKINDVLNIDAIAEEFAMLYHGGKSLRDLYKSGYNLSHYHRAIELKILHSRSRSESAKLTRSKYGTTTMGPDARQRLSKRQSLNNSGGRCKWFNVSGTKVQGTWERDIALKFNELGIRWEKPKIHKDIWVYLVNSIKKSYTPDFYLPDHTLYLEVKGYWWGNDREKMKIVLDQHPDKRLKVIEKREFNLILNNNLEPLKLT